MQWHWQQYQSFMAASTEAEDELAPPTHMPPGVVDPSLPPADDQADCDSYWDDFGNVSFDQADPTEGMAPAGVEDSQSGQTPELEGELIDEDVRYGHTFGESPHLMEAIDNYMRVRGAGKEVPYYPFSCLKDFEMGAYLAHANLPVSVESIFYETLFVSRISSVKSTSLIMPSSRYKKSPSHSPALRT